MLHGVSEDILRVIILDGWDDPVQCSAFIEGELESLDAVDADIVRTYVMGVLNSLIAFNPDSTGVEAKVPIWYDKKEKEKGSVDFWLYAGGDLVVRDLKTGTIPVDAERNPQLVAYAWGLLEDIELMEGEVERVSLEISQPSIPGRDFSYWPLTREQLECEAQKLQFASDAINAGSRKAAPGEKTCLWCAHKAVCAARAESLRIKLMADQDREEMLPPATISYLYSKKAAILAWVEAAEKEIRGHLDKYPDWKEVNGRNSRSWKDEEQMVETLETFGVESSITTVTLLSPAQAEKEVGKGILDDLIASTPGAPALVLSTDKRPSIDIKGKLKNA